MSKAVDPPTATAVRNSLEFLEGLQAVERLTERDTVTNTTNAAEELAHQANKGAQLTALGYHLAQLPVAPRIGKVLLLGAVFRCVGPALTIAASLSTRSPFMSPFDKREQADKARRDLGGNTMSDHLTLLTAYEEWQNVRTQVWSAPAHSP